MTQHIIILHNKHRCTGIYPALNMHCRDVTWAQWRLKSRKTPLSLFRPTEKKTLGAFPLQMISNCGKRFHVMTSLWFHWGKIRNYINRTNDLEKYIFFCMRFNSHGGNWEVFTRVHCERDTKKPGEKKVWSHKVDNKGSGLGLLTSEDMIPHEWYWSGE